MRAFASRTFASLVCGVALLACASCGKSRAPGEVTADGGGSGGSGDAGSGGTGGTTVDGGLAACVDQPTALPRPPSGMLPCELIPPGVRL